MTPYYTRDGITLYHADCRDLLATLEPGSVDVVITDPPYSSGGAMRNDRVQATSAKYQVASSSGRYGEFTGDNKDQRAFTSWCADWMSLMRSVAKSGAVSFVFTDWRQLPCVTDAIQWSGWIWRGVVTWHKPAGRRLQNRFASDSEFVVWGSNGPLPFDIESGAGPSSVVSCDAPRGDDRQHIAQKPIEVIEHMLRVVPDAEVVFDAFAGSATTGIAAWNLERKAILCEMDERHCELGAKRLDRVISQGRLFKPEPVIVVQKEMFGE